MLERLCEFIKEDSNRPEKQDVVIFMPSDTPPKKYAIRLAEHLGKHHLRDHVHVVTRPLDSQSKTKNNIFLVSSTAQLA